MVVGYSTPLGYPTRFDWTGLAELSVRQSEENGKAPVVSVGLGLRQQVKVTSVFDVRLIAGYSTAF